MSGEPITSPFFDGKLTCERRILAVSSSLGEVSQKIRSSISKIYGVSRNSWLELLFAVGGAQAAKEE